MRAGLRLSGNLCRSPPVNRLKAGLANDGARPNRTWTGVKSCPLFRTRWQAHSTAVWLEEGWPRLRAQSHSSRNCLTAYSVTHLSGRFLRLGKSIMGQPKRVVAPKDSWHYREVASKLRGIARQSPLPGTRQKILDFALRFEGIAEQVDRRSPTGCRPEDAC